MKLFKFADFYSKKLEVSFKMMKNTWKFSGKTWYNPGIFLLSRKVRILNLGVMTFLYRNIQAWVTTTTYKSTFRHGNLFTLNKEASRLYAELFALCLLAY